jgi:iron complex transport system ATP-binding protein
MELTNDSLLKVSGLKYQYPASENTVLTGIDCEFKAGEKVAVLGSNGAGKTTFFNLVSGLIEGYEGSIKLAGSEIKKLKRVDIAKKLALVPQKHEPLFPFTVRDFVLMGRYARLGVFGIPREEDLEVVKNAAKETGAYKFFDRPYNSLSGGEMQLAVISRALAQESELLILDEPSTHLDFKNQFVVLDLVRRISEKRKAALLMSLHNPNDVMQFADRVIVIHGGKIAADGKPADIINEKLLLDIFQVKAKEIKTDKNSVFMPVSVCI